VARFAVSHKEIEAHETLATVSFGQI
jgi:hypothetical protein